MHYQLEQWQNSRWIKETRYYSLSLCQNIFGEWILIRTWGRNKTKGSGQSLTTLCENYQSGIKLYQQQSIRRHKRGYHQTISN